MREKVSWRNAERVLGLPARAGDDGRRSFDTDPGEVVEWLAELGPELAGADLRR